MIFIPQAKIPMVDFRVKTKLTVLLPEIIQTKVEHTGADMCADPGSKLATWNSAFAKPWSLSRSNWGPISTSMGTADLPASRLLWRWPPEINHFWLLIHFWSIYYIEIRGWNKTSWFWYQETAHSAFVTDIQPAKASTCCVGFDQSRPGTAKSNDTNVAMTSMWWNNRGRDQHLMIWYRHRHVVYIQLKTLLVVQIFGSFCNGSFGILCNGSLGYSAMDLWEILQYSTPRIFKMMDA